MPKVFRENMIRVYRGSDDSMSRVANESDALRESNKRINSSKTSRSGRALRSRWAP